MRNITRVEIRRIILVTISVLVLFFFGMYQVVWAPAEERRLPPGTVKGQLIVENNGIPAILVRTTDAAGNVVLSLYTHRGKGVNGDQNIINFDFDDDASVKVTAGRVFAQGDDLGAKGGSHVSYYFESGSVTPITPFIIDGVNNNVQANFYGGPLDIDTGMVIGDELIQWKVGNITHLTLDGKSLELQLGVGYNLVVNNSGSFGDKLAVGVTVGAMDASVRYQVGGTTLASLPAPRVTTVQRLAIASGAPTDGAQADDSDLNALFRYNSPKAKWERFVVDRSPIVVMFSGGVDLPYFATSNAAYTTVGIFLFGGTTALGTPANIKVVGFKDAGPTSWDYQILDITNATTIATKTGNTGTAPEITDAGALSNLPAAQAMFEVQVRRTGGLPADFVFAHSATVEF